MLLKQTKKLFHGKYQYKVVLVCPVASWFRGCDLDHALEKLTNFRWGDKTTFDNKLKTKEDLDFCFKLVAALNKLDNFEIRVESPLLSFYTNTKVDIDTLSNIDQLRVKYISVPEDCATLVENTIILPKVPFDYRVTMGRTRQSHINFVEWAEPNAKMKLTKSCADALKRNHSWGGTYFYVKGENNLLMARMMLGGSINKVEKILKQ
jgi:hypothetical protein